MSDTTRQASSQPPIIFKPHQIIVGTAQSDGIVRDHNEDALYALNTIISDGIKEIPFGVFIVADGMGGHKNGEVASNITARILAHSLMEHIYFPLLKDDKGFSSEEISAALVHGVNQVQALVQEKAPGGGTTLTAALMVNQQLHFAHVGDSRAYFIYPDHRIEVITHDHSLVQRLFDLGQLTQEEADAHPQKNVLYRAIGQDEPLEPDLLDRPIPQPGFLLLCSDGLWGQVPDRQIMEIVLAAPSPSHACHNLIVSANDAGGPDNISAVLVQFLD